MEYNFILHNGFIEIFLLFIIVGLYYAIPKQEYLSICLLGSYICLKAVTNFAHYAYHIKTHKQ